MTPERWQLIRGILESAMEMRPAERTAYLDRQCVADPSLREDVDEMLSIDGKLDPDFLQSPVAEQAALLETSSLGNTKLAPGTRLGHYEVLALLGEGGMGEVYRGRDTRLDRIVAVKVIPCSVFRPPAASAIRAGGASHLGSAAPEHLHSARCRPPGRDRLPGDGVSGRRDAGGPATEGVTLVGPDLKPPTLCSWNISAEKDLCSRPRESE
jgi:serine/threonine protein kinase